MSPNAGSSIDKVIERIRARLVEYASCKGMKDRADDVVQETLVVLWKKYSDVKAEGELVPLAYRICKLKILEARRDQIKEGYQLNEQLPVPDTGLSIQGQLEEDEFRRRFKNAMSELSERCKMLFRLRLEERSTAEMANLMGVSAGTIYVWEHRCRKGLFEKLA